MPRASARGLGRLPRALLGRWERDPWPGNVRELKNAVPRHVALGELALDPPRSAEQEAAEPPASDFIEQVIALGLPLEEARERLNEERSRRCVRRMLDETGGNVTHAARSSGVTRRYLQTLEAKLDE